jgi:hypothetical protein
MNVMSPTQAADLMKNASKKDLITQASAAAGRKTPFTYEEAVDYLKNQILDGPKIAEEGLKLVDEEKRLSGILKSGDKSKIEAEGGEESIKKKISELKIRIANLGGEDKIKQIVSESSSGIPVRVPSTSEMASASDSDKSDQNVGKTPQGLRREQSLNRRDSKVVSENIDRDDNDIGKTIRANAAVSNTLKMDQEGFGKQSATSLLKDPFKSSDSISPSLTGPAISSTDGPSNTISTPVPSARPAVPPEASGGTSTLTRAQIDEIRELIKSNENLMSAQDGPGQNQGFIGSRMNPPLPSRMNPPLPARHPVNESLTNASIVKLAYGYE